MVKMFLFPWFLKLNFEAITQIMFFSNPSSNQCEQCTPRIIKKKSYWLMHIPWYFLLFNKKMFNYYSRYNFFFLCHKKTNGSKISRVYQEVWTTLTQDRYLSLWCYIYKSIKGEVCCPQDWPVSWYHHISLAALRRITQLYHYHNLAL